MVFHGSVSGAGKEHNQVSRLTIGKEQSKQRRWNGKVMIEQQWRTVAEVVQEAETAFEQALMERLATAVRELNIPVSVLERMQHSATVAVSRAFQYATTRVACVTVSTRAIDREDGRMPRSWGFFLVDRGSGGGVQHHIDVFVYPDES
jgi:uncharacterized protein GlcG (DUF336 family)